MNQIFKMLKSKGAQNLKDCSAIDWTENSHISNEIQAVNVTNDEEKEGRPLGRKKLNNKRKKRKSGSPYTSQLH